MNDHLREKLGIFFIYKVPAPEGQVAYLILIYMLTAIWLIHGASTTVHIYTKTIHRTTKLTTLVGRLSGIRNQSGQTKINDELNA
jgi:uncharacterized integral membrane protein